MSVGFLGRWARKKSLQDELDRRLEPSETSGQEESLEAQSTPAPEPVQANTSQESDQPEGPAPTMADVAALPPGGDVSRFMGLDVSDEVRSAALKRLFSAPEYNVRSTMDVYWEDYSNLPKLSQAEVRSLAQSKSLYLFEDPPWKSEEESSAVVPDSATSLSTEPAEPTTHVPIGDTVPNTATVVLDSNEQSDSTTSSADQPTDAKADSVVSHPKGSP
ncbi:MAG: DUF3306 domain-containing protein [Burkholderiaceae bacterium]